MHQWGSGNQRKVRYSNRDLRAHRSAPPTVSYNHHQGHRIQSCLTKGPAQGIVGKEQKLFEISPASYIKQKL